MERFIVKGEKTDAFDRFMKQWLEDRDYVLAHTSGSTGIPKEIRLLKSDMMASAERTCRFFDLKSSSVYALPLSVDYIAGKMMICRAMSSGGQLWIEEPSRTILSKCNLPDIDLLAIVPAQIESAVVASRRINIHNLIVGGAPLSAENESLLIDAGLNAYVTYGMTETCSHVALRRIGEKFYTALPGIRFSVDQQDCLTIECPDMSVGKVMTNDIVRLIDDQTFEWLGRRDNVINSGGIKLFPELIERKISHIIDDPFYITSRKSDTWGEELVLVIENNSLKKINLDISSLPLERFETPKDIIYLPKFERTPTGKIIRQKP